ncbi:unnamed protein product [Rotaria magnacalcarata]|uniref:Uncharacterized protein n=1 Tax=Rotaria magnacalcarata TaxID=392030 RepID=A0A816SV92_9BILA|nr:unnamed protein product [Rotaria magnacalcarata]
MTSFYLIFILLFFSVKSIFTEKSPFDITLNYNDKQIINRNFTLTTELHHDVLLPIDCGNNRYRLCLVALSLQIQSDIMSIKYWCQPPAFPFANLNPLQKLHTCILPAVNVTQEPTITMIINSRDIGKVTALATANFTYSPHYDAAQKTLTPIFIFNDENATKEDILSRSVRSVTNDNDDAVESELDDPDCTSEITYSSNGLPKQVDPSKDDEVGRQYLKNEKHMSHLSFQSDDAAAPVDFASGIIPDEDRDQPIGEYDDSLAVDCTKGDPLYGHPNVEWIRVANASDFMIDQRINQNVDPDSDGIDFPKMDTYILQVRMKPYVFLQYVSVPSSNVILLYVVVHYESGKRHNVYHSKVEQSPVVENFLAKEPTKFFEVYLNATDDGLPPSDVTLDVGYCIAPKNTHPIIADSEDSLSRPVDLRMNNNADQNDGSISPLISETKLNPLESPDTSMLVKNQPSISDINTENNDPRQIAVNVNGGSIILDPISQPVANDVGRIVPIFETQESPNVPIPSNSLFGTVDSTINQQGSPLLQIVRQPSMFQLPDNTVDSSPIVTSQDQPTAVQVKPPLFIAPMDISRTPTLLNNLPTMTTSQVPAQYSCYNNPRIIGNNNIQNVFSLNAQRQTTISDQINSQSSSPGYSFSSFQYPYHTIVINLRVNTYVHSLSLGSQSNVQRYGLRLYNPGRNVDDTYYSSMTPGYDNQPTVAGIPLAKVAIRLYLNLYTTSDGRPPSNIKIVLNACFDSSSMDGVSNPMIGGQYYRTPSIPQISYIPTDSQQQQQQQSYAPSPSKPIPFVRTPGQCFDQILIIGGSHITMIRSRNPVDQLVGPEINFGGNGYTFASPSDTYEFEVHFAQPFTIKYIFMSYSSNVESFKVEASHAGMLGVFTSTNTKDGLVVDGFPPMLVSMLAINIMHTTDGSLPNHVTLSIGVCNPIYSPSNEGNEAPEMTDCTSQLRLIGNSKQVARVDIKTSTMQLKANTLINPNQDGMDFLTTDEYTIDIVLNKTMSIDSVTLNPLSNVDSFKIQCHNSHGYYLEIKSIIGWKTINGLANTQANLIRIILLGTEDGNPPNHISIKIAACIPTSLPKIMRSPFKHEMITKRRKPSKFNVRNLTYEGTFPSVTSLLGSDSVHKEQQVPIQDESLQPDIQSPIFLQLTANVDMPQGQEPDIRIISSPVMTPMQQNIFVSPIVNPTLPIPSYRAPSPSGYTCLQDYQIITSVHFNYVNILCCSSQSSIMDSTSSNSLLSNNGYSFASHHYPYQTIVISLKFTGYVQSLSLGSQTNVQRYGLRVFNPARNVDDTYYSSMDPNTGQPTISNVHLAKVAIRLYVNLYTTNDGQPPRNIQLKFSICFDLRSPSNGDRPSSIVDRPLLPSPMLIPERAVYASQPLQIFVQPIISCISSPIRTLFVDEPHQPLVQPLSTEIIIEQLVPVILKQPSYIMIQSVTMPTVYIVSSPVLPPPLIVDIARYPTPIRQFDQYPSISIERIVIIEEQQPIISPQLPSVTIETVFSPIRSVPPTMLLAPLPLEIDEPIVETPSIVEETLVYQSLVIEIQQQVIVSPMIQPPMIDTIYSPIRIVPQVIILRMPSPIIDPPIIEQPIIRRPPPIIIEEIINIVERPVVQPSILIERIISPIIEIPSVVEETLVYQSLVIEIQQQVIVSPMIQPPIISTIYSPVRTFTNCIQTQDR